MKKIIALLLVIATLIPFAGCADDPILSESTEESAEETKKTGKENENGEVTNSVAEPLTMEKLLSMKVATPDMSEDELRDLVLEFMTYQNSFPWVAGATYTNSIKQNEIYLGLPYQNHSGSIYCWADFTDPATGVFKVDSTHKYDSYFGNDCADQVFWSWARVSSSISFGWTRHMNENSGALKVGKYTYPKDLTDFETHTTTDICKENGTKVMYESYAALKKADAVVNYYYHENKSVYAGHAMLIKEVHVEKTGGAIDPVKSYVCTVEQTGEMNATTYNGKPATDISTVGDGSTNKYTFEKLYSVGYLPVTCAELEGTKKVQKSFAKTDKLENGKTYTLEDIRNAHLLTNYRISNVYFKVVNDKGEVLSNRVFYGKDTSGTEYCMYDLLLEDVTGKAFSNTVKGTNKVTVDVVIASGEKITAFDGYMTYQ